MSTSDAIRSLASEGLPVAEIARRLGVSYQHAYNVLKAAGRLAPRSSNVAAVTATPLQASTAENARPVLSTAVLLGGGFQRSGEWVLTCEGELVPDQPLSKARGVYAFVKDAAALYVGLATMGLSKRLYFYGRPGATQRTSLRINAAIKAELAGSATIEIYTATPPALAWNGLPVAGDAGLELGLIQTFYLPWNMRGL
ncbi:MAG: helix-turn-helix domain-containing protein [Methylobacterium sp.]|uniref:helix-turn-helix domain-containing protein n=1 Tax=Methylobacterium sp. TaxID=409 RepID=UPI0025DFAF5B|nr:helix-turn-helix domain-containing protein [Methylobacterium sp.]MBX9934329.1 helix-turn-helix domain-containing protein [Methylobacterium sp.]